LHYHEGLQKDEAPPVDKKPRKGLKEEAITSHVPKTSPTEMITHTRVESLTMPHQQGFIGMEVKAMTQVEQGMAKAMTYNTTVPQFYLMEDLIMTNLMKLRARLNEGKSKEEKISVMPLMIKTFSMALKHYPKVNALYYPERPYEYELHSSHNISIAIDSKYGLIAPNIKDCQNKSILEIDQELKRLRNLSDEGHVGSNELFGGTSAISNIGNICGTYAGPVLLPNQVFIVAMGRVRKEPAFVNPVEVNGKTLYEVDMQDKINISCGCDHRTLDGATAARFVKKWKELVEHPENWILEMK